MYLYIYTHAIVYVQDLVSGQLKSLGARSGADTPDVQLKELAATVADESVRLGAVCKCECIFCFSSVYVYAL